MPAFASRTFIGGDVGNRGNAPIRNLAIVSIAMARRCSVCNTLTAMELKTLNRDLQAGIAVESLARQYPALHPSSIRRHGWNHIDRGPIRDVKITATESAFDQISSLADSLRAAEMVRVEATRRNQGHLVLRAAQTERALSKFLFEELQITSLQVADFIRDSNTFGRAVFRLLRARPEFAEALAKELEDEPTMADEVRHLGTAAITKEGAA